MSANKSFSNETSERYSRALFEVLREDGELDKSERDIKNFQSIPYVDEGKKISDGTLFPLSPNYSKYSNILISLGGGENPLNRYEIIDKCDLFIIVGERGKFCLDDVEPLMHIGFSGDQKCAGFVLMH